MKEGDAFNAANTNADVDALIAAVNSLTFDENVQPRALDAQHLPGLLGDDASTDKMKGDGMLVTTPAVGWSSTTAFQAYSNELAPAGVHPKNLQTFIGLGPGGGAGWRRVARSGVAANACAVSWPAGTTFSNYSGVLISASVVIGHSDYGEQGDAVTPSSSCFALAIAIKDSLGNFYAIPRSVRCFNSTTSVGERVSLTTVITQADLDAAAISHGGNADIDTAVLVFGRFLPTTVPTAPIAGVGSVGLGPYNIMQMPMHYGTLV